MKGEMDLDMARLRHDEAAENLAKATRRLIVMCGLKLLDMESIQEQACVVAGLVCSERDTRGQLAEGRRAQSGRRGDGRSDTH